MLSVSCPGIASTFDIGRLATDGKFFVLNSGTLLLKKLMNFCASPSPSGARNAEVGGGVSADNSEPVFWMMKFGV